MKRYNRFLAPLALLVLAALACNFPFSKPRTPNPVPTEAVGQLEESLKKAGEQATKGDLVTLALDENQITDFLASKLQGQDKAPFQDPRVFLRDGQIQLFGTVERQKIALPAQAVISVTLDPYGQPRFSIESAKIGPLPVPDTVQLELEANLDRAFAQQIEAVVPNTRIESIIIGDGLMFITGQAR